MRFFRTLGVAGPACALALLAASVLEAAATPQLVINSPSSIAGTYAVGTASFGPSLDANSSLTGNVTLVHDNVGNFTDGCSALINFVPGSIALIDRGGCVFTDKVRNAQDAGAIAVIVVNNVAGPAINMTGVDPTITIPSVMVSQADGNLIKAH